MKVLMFSFVILAAQSVCAAPEIKGSPGELKSFLYPEKNVVRITGYAEREAFSDKAIVNLIIKSEDKLMSEAMSINSGLRDAISKELVASGVSSSSINNSKFLQSPQYGWFGKAPSSYEVVNRLSVEILEEQHLKKLAQIADRYPEVTMGKFSFKHTKKDELTQRVKDDALKKIESQKTQYELALGLKLKAVGIQSLDEDHGATEGAEMIEEVVVYGIRASSDRKLGSYSQPQAPRNDTFEEVKYSANIVVEYVVATE